MTRSVLPLPSYGKAGALWGASNSFLPQNLVFAIFDAMGSKPDMPKLGRNRALW